MVLNPGAGVVIDDIIFPQQLPKVFADSVAVALLVLRRQRAADLSDDYYTSQGVRMSVCSIARERVREDADLCRCTVLEADNR